MRVSLLALRYSPRWRSRILSGVSSLTAITAPSLFKRLDESRAPSLRWHYPASSVPLRPSDFSPACPGLRLPFIPSHRGHHPRRTRSPALPSAASPTCPPDDPGEPICSCIGYLHRWRRPSPLDHRVGTLTLQSRGSMGSLIVRPVSLRSFPKKIFSIHLVLRVAPQNRIFANGVYR